MSRRVERVSFISDAPHFGGAERYLIDMCTAARRRSIHAHIHWIDLRPKSQCAHSAKFNRQRTIEPEAQAKGWQDDLPSWFDAIKQNVSLSKQNGYSFRDIHCALRREQPDAVIVNASGRPGMWRAIWACRCLGVASAWVHHMIDPVDPRRLAARYMQGKMQGLSLWRIPQTFRHRLAAAGASVVIASNDDDAAYVRRWGLATAGKTHIIPPGIDADRFNIDPQDRTTARRRWLSRQADGTFVVGTASRLVDGKGIDALIDAVGLLACQYPHLSMLVAGTGPRVEAFSQIVRARGLDQRIQFIGFVENMPEFYAALDVFALCSTTESFGLALTEAMTCERAPLATPTPGALRQIRHGHNGLITQGFTSDVIAAGLKTLIDNPQLRQHLASQARRSALSNFTIDQTFEATLSAAMRRDKSAPPTRRSCRPDPTAPEVFA